MTAVLSIGHSTLSYDEFAGRLKAFGVTAVADVRSAPFSRHFPHFNRNTLKDALKADGIAYVFLGDELGGRPKDAEYYTGGIADYEKMVASDAFLEGLERVERGAEKYRIAMMCSEQNPLDCHRCLLVGRALFKRGIRVGHITSGAELIDQEQIETMLLSMIGKNESELFASPSDRIHEAYRHRSRRVAYAEANPNSADSIAAE